ncbi:MAG: hypothetical protein V3U60_11815, partial [Gammaproteobacteria bacterium]
PSEDPLPKLTKPECPLFPKADIQALQKPLKLRSAFGQKRSFTDAKSKPPKLSTDRDYAGVIVKET